MFSKSEIGSANSLDVKHRTLPSSFKAKGHNGLKRGCEPESSKKAAHFKNITSLRAFAESLSPSSDWIAKSPGFAKVSGPLRPTSPKSVSTLAAAMVGGIPAKANPLAKAHSAQRTTPNEGFTFHPVPERSTGLRSSKISTEKSSAASHESWWEVNLPCSLGHMPSDPHGITNANSKDRCLHMHAVMGKGKRTDLTSFRQSLQTYRCCDAATMTFNMNKIQKEVGVQAVVDIASHSTATSPTLNRTSQVSAVDGSTGPSPHSSPRLLQNCPTDLQEMIPVNPACPRRHSLLKCPSPQPEPQQRSKRDSDCTGDCGAEGLSPEEKPQEVVWDEQGMTWEVYGAAVELEYLGAAIQTHLESKSREQQGCTRTLRMSICSEHSIRGLPPGQKVKSKTNGFLCCWANPSDVDD